MGCGGSCGTCGTGGGGCSSGSCSTGGCNRLNVFDWLSDLSYSPEQERFDVIEVSFKNGARKSYYRNSNHVDVVTGDQVVVESKTSGHDIGTVSLQGELVKLQLKKKRIRKDGIQKVLRRPTERDMERYQQAKQLEYSTMTRARVIARHLGLKMKIGDVEFQADNRKATFYYTADGRVDFRELIREFAREFRIKVEMRQIGSRQEAGRIGGIGSCGRELCCSTWLTHFKSVSTTAARYQNLAINQAKLSGQCGRLKCCLNYELEIYLDALTEFPKNLDSLETEKGRARLVKTDIFKRKLWYVLPDNNLFIPVSLDLVKEILEMNARGEKPKDLKGSIFYSYDTGHEEPEEDPDMIVGSTSLEVIGGHEPRRKKRRKKKPGNRAKGRRGKGPGDAKGRASSKESGEKQGGNKQGGAKQGSDKSGSKSGQPRSEGGKRNKDRSGSKPANRDHRSGGKRRSDRDGQSRTEGRPKRSDKGKPENRNNRDNRDNRENPKKQSGDKRKDNAPNKSGDVDKKKSSNRRRPNRGPKKAKDGKQGGDPKSGPKKDGDNKKTD